MLVQQDDQVGADSGPEEVDHGSIELVGTAESVQGQASDGAGSIELA
jgi:hypothetical protein